MKAKAGLIIKEIEDEYILVDSGIETPKFNGMIKLNDSSKFIIEALMKEDLTIDELVDKMFEHYDATKEELKEGILPVIEQLKKIKIIK